ncbi:MAG: mechanosensitive ion channel [Bacteroidetes bacterium]|nr:mechanosensitive ion channel [Bacteroidota bacterium]MCA6442945.1 mechanosensitive ion channel [Bacteroidota bacterium]
MLNLFSAHKIQLIETGIVLVVFMTLKFILKYLVKITILNSVIKRHEKKEIHKIINLLVFVVLFTFIVSIWSVKQDNVLVFASTLLTVFGVALFAEMSILSNITAYLILFFQHPVKIGDKICVNSEGIEIIGKVKEMTYFFIFIEKEMDQSVCSIPNALLLKSSFSVFEES